MLDLLRSHMATVLGTTEPDAIAAELAFSDHGFDSLTAVELRNRLKVATGLALSPTLIFDYPTPATLAGYIRQELAGATQAVEAGSQLALSVIDEPIAVVGMSCRYPGGVDSPESLWDMVAEGRDVRHRLPERPRLGPGRAVQRRPRRTRQVVRPHRRLPRRRRRLRRVLLRGVAQRGARDGSPTAAVPRIVLGGTGTRRLRPCAAARQCHRRVRRCHRPGLRPGSWRCCRSRGFPADRAGRQRRIGPRLLRARAGGARGVDRHGVLVVVGRAAHGGTGAAARRVRPRPGRRRHRECHPRHLRRVQQAARTVLRRTLQGVRGRRRRHRLRRRRRCAAGRKALGCKAARPSGARDRARIRRQPGRRVQRADRAERTVPAARRARGAGQRRAVASGRRRRRGSRHRHHAG